MIKGILSIFLFTLISLVCYSQAKDNNGIYIVYMGASSSTNGTLLRDDHAKLLNSLFTRNENKLVHTYKHGFSGFAARLSKEEADQIAKKSGVVSVFRDQLLELHTTHSWDFLKYQTTLKIDSYSKPNLQSANDYDSIIGVLDTGIWPESSSFDDKGMSPIPSRWKGTCMKSRDTISFNCNRKVIGARYYAGTENKLPESMTARDTVGHGTHVASTAAGTPVSGASYYGLASGSAKGGSPGGTRIAMYRVCSPDGCHVADVMAAFDDAIADGVDVLSLSMGLPATYRPGLEADPIAIGSFHAAEKGIVVVCSAGNDGPKPGTVTNAVPWVLTVGATTIDRDFRSDVLLGVGNRDNKLKLIKGEGINFSSLQKSPVYPLIHGKAAKKVDAKEDAASNCESKSMEESKVKGKIVVCEKTDDYSVYDKRDTVKSLGGIGVVIVDDLTRGVAENFKEFPATVVSSKDAQDIVSYLSSSRNPVATILPTETVSNRKPAPSVAYFSSRGPSYITPNILKPDISAPGVNILASWMANDSHVSLQGKEPTMFNVLSGTSMACPHVSGIVASVKSRHSDWSPSAIKSAIITTATQTNNLKAAVTTDSGSEATPYDYGAGEVTTERPLEPGLVYETTNVDYFNYFCHLGFDIRTIKMISRTVPEDFRCPTTSSNSELISNINYPSVAISNFDGATSKTISRTVTHVGNGETVFTATVESPSGLDVKVIPEELQFNDTNQKLSYQVIFTRTGLSATQEPIFGSILWTNEQSYVRTPFVLTNEG